MNTLLRVLVSLILLLSLVGCQSSFIPIPNLVNQPIDSGLSQEQIRKAIKVGAVSAGWRVDLGGGSSMLATYKIRSHTVIVTIAVAADRYDILYENSIEMKVKCSQYADAQTPAKVTTGQSPCPGGAPPAFIHQNYKDWVEGLNRSIQIALRSA